MRRVVLLCGPPGAGKTTAAHASGLPVYDRDDPHWISESHWTMALTKLGRSAAVRAVVIRSGASSTARARTARLIAATDVRLVIASRDELRRRVRDRGREDMVRTLMGIDQWFTRFDRNDGTPDFIGWPEILGQVDETGVTSTDW